MPGHFDGPEGNVWGEEQVITPEMLASLNEPITENASTGGGEPSDPSATNEQKSDAGASAPSDVPPTTNAAEHFEAWVKEQSAKFEAGDTESVLYKPFQRSLSKADRENRELRQLAESQATQISQLLDNLTELGDGTNILFEHVTKALPDANVAELRAALSAKQTQNLQARLTRVTAKPTPPPSEVPAPVPTGPSDAIRELMEKANKEFVESRQAAARKAGVDPSTVALEYGTPEEGVVARLNKFEASLDAAIKAKEDGVIDSVRQRTPVVGTRTSGGVPPSVTNGESALSRGARSRTEQARKSGFFA